MKDRIILQQVYISIAGNLEERIAQGYEERTGDPISVNTVRELLHQRAIGPGVMPYLRMSKVRWDIAVKLLKEDPWALIHIREFSDQYNKHAEKTVSRGTMAEWLHKYGIGVAMGSPHWEEEILIAIKDKRGNAYTIPEEADTSYEIQEEEK